MINKCVHGVYDPHGDGHYCQTCNPHAAASLPTEKAPHFNRRGSLNLTETGKLPKCPNCSSILTVSSGGVCRHCGEQFEILAPEHLRANNTQAGLCPDCGSGVHYETKVKSVWACADCGREYKAARLTDTE